MKTRVKRCRYLAGVILLTVWGSSFSHAAPRIEGYYGGIQLGPVTLSDNGNSDLRLGFGFEGGVKLNENLRGGLNIFTSSETVTSSGLPATETRFRTTYFGLEADYLFSDQWQGVYGGPNLGIASSSRTETFVQREESLSGTGFFLGLHGGYEHFFENRFSVSGEVQFLLGFGNTPDSSLGLILSGKIHF